MKLHLITFIAAICCYSASAQESTERHIRFNFIKGDSTRLSLNEQFNLIEDSCSQVYRYAHVDIQNKIFTGPFTDVSHADPKLIITQGAYNIDGLKDGPFIINYLNGNLQAKGSFKNGVFDGKWDVYYDNGKPQISFEANDRDIKIIDEWDNKGIKTVTNGNGIYRADLGFLYWQGKLLNGRPDGKWKSKRASDNADFSSEVYKNGVFQKGMALSEYTDEPRMALISPSNFPFITAEKFQLSDNPCDGTKTNVFVDAHFTGSLPTLTNRIDYLVYDYLRTPNLMILADEITLEGEVNVHGDISKLHGTTSNVNAVLIQTLIGLLQKLPKLTPATLNGKPVKQGFAISFKFSGGYYRFNYKFLPVPH
jgi:hypothetical protein